MLVESSCFLQSLNLTNLHGVLTWKSVFGFSALEFHVGSFVHISRNDPRWLVQKRHIFSPLAKTNPFQVWCYKPFPGLANIEPIYGPKALNRFCSFTPGRKSHQKNTKTTDQVLIKILLKTMTKSYIFWPHKGGNPTRTCFV